MSDDHTIKNPEDLLKINMNEPYEVNYWINALECTKEELIAEVNAVGVSSSAVKKDLGKFIIK